MKKLIIASVVGGTILFLWQFLSWQVLHIHASTNQYTPKQDSIMAYLSTQFEDDGFYIIPNYPENSSAEEAQKILNESIGKPWAQIAYHKKMENNMFSSMARGIISDILAVLLLSWLLIQVKDFGIKTSLLASLAVGLVSWLTTSYLNAIWYAYPSMPDLIDAIVSYAMVGVWLGWYLPGKQD